MINFKLHCRPLLRGFLAVLICGMFGMVWSPAASADSVCPSGNLSGLMDTTCDIGSLQFTFVTLFGYNYSYDFSTQTYTYGTQWTASNFTFTPVSNGFTLAFDGGPQSITAPLGSNFSSYNGANLYFLIADLNGMISGINVTGGTLSATGNTSSNASYFGEVCGGTSCLENKLVGGTQTTQNGGTQYTENLQFQIGSLFSSGAGLVSPFDLYALNGDSASWDGTPITYTLDSVPVATPEPGSLLLLCTGLLGMATIRLRPSAKKTEASSVLLASGPEGGANA